MRIVAVDNPVIVNFRIKGKFYNQQTEGEQAPSKNSDTHSEFPFDSVTLQPFQEFQRNDTIWVEAKEVTEVADHSQGAGNTGE